MKSTENQDNQYQLVFEILRLLLDKETLFNAYEEPQADLVAKWISIRALTRILSTASASVSSLKLLGAFSSDLVHCYYYC